VLIHFKILPTFLTNQNFWEYACTPPYSYTTVERGDVMFACSRSNVISVLCSKDFRPGWPKQVWLERRF